MVIEEPSFLAPTTTPSIAASFSELICPLSAMPGEFAALLRRGANKNEAIASIPTTARSAAFFMRTSSDSVWLPGTSESTLRLKLKYTQGTPQNNRSGRQVVGKVAQYRAADGRPNHDLRQWSTDESHFRRAVPYNVRGRNLARFSSVLTLDARQIYGQRRSSRGDLDRPVRIQILRAHA